MCNQLHLATVANRKKKGHPLGFRFISLPAIGPRSTKKNAHSQNTRDVRRPARIGRDQTTVPVLRTLRGRRAPGGGTATPRKEREREREIERKREKEGERGRMGPGRALRRECSRAGNQCRFRGSGGHHAADYTDYTRLHLYSTALTVTGSFPGRSPVRSRLIPSVA